VRRVMDRTVRMARWGSRLLLRNVCCHARLVELHDLLAGCDSKRRARDGLLPHLCTELNTHTVGSSFSIPSARAAR
jgi:hypothetical protein